MNRTPVRRQAAALCCILALCLAGALTGCSTPGRSPGVEAEGSSGADTARRKLPPTQRPYRIKGIWYHPLPDARGYRQSGIASWYGKPFHGRKTSCGDTYNMYGISAAHKTLPMGTHVVVRNLENGRSIRLAINDRGPFVAGRIIDLSYGAAKRLDMVGRGTARVEVVAIGTSTSRSETKAMAATPANSDQGRFTIQVGAFGDQKNARKLAEALRKTYKDAQVLPPHPPGGARPLYRVVVGECTSLRTAQSYENALRSGGFPDAFTIAQ